MGSQPPVDPEVVATLRRWVETHFGIRFAPGQEDSFGSRLEGYCRAHAITAEALQGRLSGGDRALVLGLAEAMSTNYTTFFREPEIFTFLGETILPTLPTQEPARFWSAASSSGEEAYSLAIYLQERLGEMAASARVRILGTDISERHVRSAEEGIFSTQKLEQLDPSRRRSFDPLGIGQWRASASLRRMCTFRRMNLTQPTWPFEQRFHVIFLRNVLYYFAASMRRSVVEACYDAAEPGAWLITSLTEPMLDMSTRWSQLRPAIFRKEAR
jgi:chemotaxis protein methyltransferase CheR